MNKNKLIKKIKSFFKRNSYAIAISFCVVLVLSMITLTAVNYAEETTVPIVNVENDNINNEDNVPTTTPDVVVFVSPIADAKILKEYADDHLLEDKTTGFWKTHQAIDYVASEGTKVLAVYDGEVEKIEHSMMDGLVITIKHKAGLKSVYKCLGDEALVAEGDKVVAGQEIGTVSSNLTEKADGCHLHFELYENNILVDPTPYFTELGK